MFSNKKSLKTLKWVSMTAITRWKRLLRTFHHSGRDFHVAGQKLTLVKYKFNRTVRIKNSQELESGYWLTGDFEKKWETYGTFWSFFSFEKSLQWCSRPTVKRQLFHLFNVSRCMGLRLSPFFVCGWEEKIGQKIEWFNTLLINITHIYLMRITLPYSQI